MKIGEAREIYAAKLNEFWEQKLALSKQKKALEEKSNAVVNGKEIYANEAANLELSYNAFSEKYDEYKNFMEKVSSIHTGIFNAEVSRQQGEAMADYVDDLGKIMEVARRIAKGAKVPSTDEQKLMEYSMEMYMTAKNMAMLNELKEKEEYDSLWDEEDDNGQQTDPQEVADNTELSIAAPKLEEVSDVMADDSAKSEGVAYSK